jgi:tripartite-type tricarboxylate transporter receptor subunit TctC
VAGNASPREFSDFVRKEAAQWAKVIKTAGIKAN